MPYETDERLKSYLDTNQMHREQLCLAVTAIDRRFSNVRPRHPRGGPDGARDIEAVFNGVQRVFGAVGFINQANDSEEHRKNARKKFKTDLGEALKQDPRPEVFIFLTNVNLTHGEKDELEQWARGNGLTHAEIFDRERIRIALDGADGFSIRFQYLRIPLSEAEQATFFARWGDDIQGLISDGFGAVQESLNRIHFFQEAMLPLTHMWGLLELNREYSGTEIGHFRAFVFMQLKAPIDGILNLYFGATDNASRPNAKTEEDLAKGLSGIANGTCGGLWVQEIRESSSEENVESQGDEEDDESGPFTQVSGFSSVGSHAVKKIVVPYNNDPYIRLKSGPRLIDIDEAMFVFCLNSSLAKKLRAFKLFANEYQLMEVEANGFSVDTSPRNSRDPFFYSSLELSDEWVRLRPKSASAFHIRFSEQTPGRYYHAVEISGSTTRTRTRGSRNPSSVVQK